MMTYSPVLLLRPNLIFEQLLTTVENPKVKRCSACLLNGIKMTI